MELPALYKDPAAPARRAHGTDRPGLTPHGTAAVRSRTGPGMRRPLLTALLAALLLSLPLAAAAGPPRAASARPPAPRPPLAPPLPPARPAGGAAGRGRARREEPPLSIDLTFHLLRHMLEAARAQSQRAQAERNRLIFDSVGK
ncbi:urocortin [Emydura macquarii macquarii]|uniref:urocortin n=1 Tax=Emydura macquarii macquarii TaxID=1129001 RepID=UPI00352A3BF5